MWAPIERTMAKQVRHVRAVPRAELDPTSQAVAAQIERDFGAFVPPFALHAAVPSLLAATWAMLRESLVPAHVDRRTKEAVASAVSRSNACTYCVDAHTAALDALGARDAADALADPDARLADDHPLAAIVRWAATTRTPGSPRLAAPPFSRAQAPEVIGIALCFHYVNRMVSVFLAPSPLPFANGRLKSVARRALRPLLTGMLTRPLAPGESLAWLPEAPLPDDLAWAAGNAGVAAAFARAAASIDRAGRAALPEAVRRLVLDYVGRWDGEEPPLGRGWMEQPVASLAAADRPTARLALLTALAPTRVGAEVLAEFRRVHPDDATLIAAAAWASFAATRRIGRWIAVPVA